MSICSKPALLFLFLWSTLLCAQNRADDSVRQEVEAQLALGERGEISLASVENFLEKYLNEDKVGLTERIIYAQVQKNPSSDFYNDLLLWFSLKREDYERAFVQAKAIDKRKKTGGQKLFETGTAALKSKNYEFSLRVFDYIVQEYPQSELYSDALNGLIKSREEQIKEKYPPSAADIRLIMRDYDRLVAGFPDSKAAGEALLSKASLYAFALDMPDSALEALERIISSSDDKDIVSRAKLRAGDIKLLKGEPWESALLYAQVEKANKGENIGREAKLKEAKLSYYKGEFALAREQLDILKSATSKEISNDAMELSLFIQDYTYGDSTGAALKLFAEAELLEFRNKYQEAVQRLDKLISEYPGHSLVSEALFKQASVLVKTGGYDEALLKLKKILEQYGDNIRIDDALMFQAKIREIYKGDSSGAKQDYKELIDKFPGSILVSEARRKLESLK